MERMGVEIDQKAAAREKEREALVEKMAEEGKRKPGAL